jgi:hypothetical protein
MMNRLGLIVFLFAYPLLMPRVLQVAYANCSTKAQYIGSTVFALLMLAWWMGVAASAWCIIGWLTK